ncbi:unnamed protein product, partial [Ectocarpus sp. 12 AP-2014]
RRPPGNLVLSLSRRLRRWLGTWLWSTKCLRFGVITAVLTRISLWAIWAHSCTPLYDTTINSYDGVCTETRQQQGMVLFRKRDRLIRFVPHLCAACCSATRVLFVTIHTQETSLVRAMT